MLEMALIHFPVAIICIIAVMLDYWIMGQLLTVV